MLLASPYTPTMNLAISDPTQDLKVFFAGLDGALNSYRHVRSLYDEQVAFGFNYTSIFGPDENRISKVLAFLLDPNNPHGQKATFLKLFLNLFDLKAPSALLEDGKKIEVHAPYQTKQTKPGRFIDITIHFGNNDYVIGIENKIWEWTRDQPNQLNDYAEELKSLTSPHDNWVLFYLTPDRHDPSEGSITPQRRSELEKAERLKIISYRKDIKELLEQCELACKADNVRAFLKDFRQWINQDILGEANMGDQQVIVDYLRNDPSIVGNIRPLNVALDTLKKEYRDKLVTELKTQLRRNELESGDPFQGAGGPNSRDWYITKSHEKLRFGNTDINIRIQEDSSGCGLRLRIGVTEKVTRLNEFVKSITPELRYDGGWNGGYYDVSEGDCLSDKNLTQHLKDPTHVQKTVKSWVKSISNYVDTVVGVCKEQK